MTKLRRQIIKLAYENPDLRHHLLPVLSEAEARARKATFWAHHFDPDDETLADDLLLRASNEGRFYRNKDAKGAVDFAWGEYVRDRNRLERESFRIVKPHVIRALQKSWASE